MTFRSISTSSADVSRAFGPGSRIRLLAAGAIAAVAVAAGLGAYIAFRNDSSPASTYGQIPSWLPKATIPVDRIVTASAAHPWLAVQGDTVSVRLARGRVLATTVGPAVPEEGQFPVPKTTLCTFTVTFSSASGSVPIRPSAFTILDELGHIHHPTVTRGGGGAPPSHVSPGHTVTLTVRDVLPTGDGHLRWAPEDAAPIVSWDFDVEID